MRDVDLDLIAEVMTTTHMGGYVDPASGSFYIGADGEILNDAGEALDDIPASWIEIPEEATGAAHDDMSSFAALIADDRLGKRLARALDGRGAFRRFRTTVDDAGPETGRLWARYSTARRRVRVIDWLSDAEALPPEELNVLGRAAAETIAVIAQELAAQLNAVLAHVEALERELQSPGCRASRQRLEELLADDFNEVGASGLVWTRTEILDLVTDEHDEQEIGMHDVRSLQVTADVVLVRWRSDRDGRRAERSSLWRRTGDDWRLVHHQGTLLP